MNPRNCVGCAFQTKEGGRQIACQNPFVNWSGVQIEEVDGDFWFKNSACQYKRPEGWCPQLSFEEKIAKTREESKISWTLIYDPHGLPINSELRACENLLNSDLPPKKVFCHVRSFEEELVRTFPQINFLIVEEGELVRFLSQHHPNHLFCFSKHPQKIEENFFANLDVKINEERFSFQVLENEQMQIFSGNLWKRGLDPDLYLKQAYESGIVRKI